VGRYVIADDGRGPSAPVPYIERRSSSGCSGVVYWRDDAGFQATPRCDLIWNEGAFVYAVEGSRLLRVTPDGVLELGDLRELSGGLPMDQIRIWSHHQDCLMVGTESEFQLLWRNHRWSVSVERIYESTRGRRLWQTTTGQSFAGVLHTDRDLIWFRPDAPPLIVSPAMRTDESIIECRFVDDLLQVILVPITWTAGDDPTARRVLLYARDGSLIGEIPHLHHAYRQQFSRIATDGQEPPLYGIVDATGRWLTPPRYERIPELITTPDGATLAVVESEFKRTVFDIDGRECFSVSKRHGRIRSLSANLFVVTVGSEYRLLDAHGVEVIDRNFSQIVLLGDDILLVESADEARYLRLPDLQEIWRSDPSYGSAVQQGQ
jgi:hypothetical protein